MKRDRELYMVSVARTAELCDNTYTAFPAARLEPRHHRSRAVALVSIIDQHLVAHGDATMLHSHDWQRRYTIGKVECLAKQVESSC